MRAALLVWLLGATLALGEVERGWELLETFSREAPARQVGQPGNAWTDQWVEETFQHYVARNGGPDSKQYSAMQKDYEGAVDRVLEGREAVYLEEVSPRLFHAGEEGAMVTTRASLRSAILRTPTPIVVVLSGGLLLLLAAWWFQRRRELIWAAVGVVLALLIFLAVVGAHDAGIARDAKQSGQPMAAKDRFTAAAQEFLRTGAELNKSLDGRWQRGRTTHQTAAFIPGAASISTDFGEAILYQLAPNLSDPGNFSEPTLNAPLLYVGQGGFEALRAADNLAGALVVMEFESWQQWVTAVELGARAVIFVPPGDGRAMSSAEAYRKVSTSPLSVPRFYLPREDAERILGPGWDEVGSSVKTVRLSQEPGQWKRVPVHTDWLFIPGGGDVSQLVHLQAFKDAASIVPELSPGAGATVNLAAIAELLERFTQEPPAQPVLISIVNDHCNALNGEYEFSAMAFTPPETLAEELDRLDNLHSQSLLVSRVFGQEPTPALMEYLRVSIERVGGRSFTVKQPAVNRLMMRRNDLRGEQNLLELELQSASDPQAREAIQARVRKIRQEVDETVSLLGLFNRFGHKTRLADLNPDQVQALRVLFAQLASDAEKDAALLETDRRELWNNLFLRNRLSGITENPEASDWSALIGEAFPPIPALAAFQLDLGTDSDEFGFFHWGEVRLPFPRFRETERVATERIARLSRLTLEVAAEMAAEDGQPVSSLRNTLLGVGGLPWQAHVGGAEGLAGPAFHQFARPGLTLASVSDQRPRLFTPSDRLDQLDKTRVEEILDWTSRFFPRLINSERLIGTQQKRGAPLPFAVELTVRQTDRFSVGTPQTVLDSALILGFPSAPIETTSRPYVGQVRSFPTLMANAAGRQTLRGELWRQASLLCFGFNKDQRQMTAALDLHENERRFFSTLSLTERVMFTNRSVVTFECLKTDIFGMTTPLTLEPLLTLDVLDARNDSRARHFSLAGIESVGLRKRIPMSFDGTASVFVEPEVPFKLRSGEFLAINSDAENPRGRGFAADTGLIRDLPLVMAHDYQRLANTRLRLLASRGVGSDSAEALNAEAGAVLDKAVAAPLPADRLVLAEVARGLSFQAYESAVATINDLVKAVVILLALVLPFCFFLVKLLSPFTDANRQILLFMACFAAFALLLYFIQPAFAVGDRPEVIILAFVILGLALFVASVIVGRFDTAMNQAVEQLQLSESPEAPQGRLAGVAFMVGVNNMKKRRIRTTLTCATIVLVTFTILSVISVRQSAEPLQLRIGAEAPYNGFVFMRPGMEPFTPLQLSRFRAHFSDGTSTTARSWSMRQDIFGSYLPFPFERVSAEAGAPRQRLDLPLILGLETTESNFVDDLSSQNYMVAGSRWFSSNDADEVIISRSAAKLLGIDPADFANERIALHGRPLQLVGIFEDAAIEELRDLRNTPLLPLKVDPTAALETDLSEHAADISTLPGVSVASGLEVALLPSSTADSLGSAATRVLAVKYLPQAGESMKQASARMWTDVQRLLRFQNVYLSVGVTEPVDRGEGRAPLEPGEYTLASSSGSEIGGVLTIAIPVILAATIILNTMLGAVMERKKEISIYNAIGLNPSHVMMFFLAEALVFGLVGSVAGYFIGQVFSVTAGHFLDINLNYSSLSVMVVIFLTIATVMLSTLYPADMAARAAVPSGQRKWSLPSPDGDEIHLRFPFSYDPRRILAICAYLHEFMQQNSEASTGRFLARLRQVGKVPSASGPSEKAAHASALAMVYDVTPIPFDLGVNQKMELYADYDPEVKAHMLSVHLTRESGEKHSWTTVNQPFLEALRKRLLGWRSQRPEIQEAYYAAGEALFRDAPELAGAAPTNRPVTN